MRGHAVSAVVGAGQSALVRPGAGKPHTQRPSSPKQTPRAHRYILPALSLVPGEAEESVRVEYAGILAALAHTAARFLARAQRLPAHQALRPLLPHLSQPCRAALTGVVGAPAQILDAQHSRQVTDMRWTGCHHPKARRQQRLVVPSPWLRHGKRGGRFDVPDRGSALGGGGGRVPLARGRPERAAVPARSRRARRWCATRRRCARCARRSRACSRTWSRLRVRRPK